MRSYTTRVHVDDDGNNARRVINEDNKFDDGSARGLGSSSSTLCLDA